jgi:predicted Zn-dependent protease
MKQILLVLLAALFFACGSNDDGPQFHPDAEALQIEALKVYHRKPDSALSVLDKAVQMDPSFYLAYNTKAMILIEKGDDAKAIAELHKSLHWREDQPEVYLQLGMLNDRQNLPERAQDHYLRAKAAFDMRLAEDSPFRVQDEANRAITQIMLGETQAGNSVLDRLIAEHPDNPFLQDLAKRRAKARDGQVFDKTFYISALLD